MSIHEGLHETGPSGWTLSGWHVLVALLSFFGVMIAANMVFVYFAVTTFTGIETADAYRKGVAYNARLEEARQFEKLGWHGKIAEKDGRLEVVILSQDGTPVRGVRVGGKVGRPATDRFDQTVVFEHTGSGRYRTEKIDLAPGHWIVTIEAREPVSNEVVRLRLKERLWLSQ